MERKGLIGMTVDALKRLAGKLKVMGRGSMSKKELVQSVLEASRKASEKIVRRVRGEKTQTPAGRKVATTRAKTGPVGPAKKTGGRAAVERRRSARPARARSTRVLSRKARTGGAREGLTSPTPAPPPVPSAAPWGPPPMPQVHEAYGTDRIVLLARDPDWLFAYWEVTPPSREKASRRLADPRARLSMRVYDVTGVEFDGTNARRTLDIAIPDETLGNWYIQVWEHDATYVVDIGYVASDGRFVTIVRSNPVHTPRATLSDKVDQAWMTVEADYERIFQLSGGGSRGLASDQIKELLAQKIRGQLASGDVTSWGSIGRAPVAEREAAKGFWLQVQTELIVHGSTEPTAKVTVMGQEVSLRPDGTFTLRFALPDGRQEIEVEARSASDESRRITPVVEKRTRA